MVQNNAGRSADRSSMLAQNNAGRSSNIDQTNQKDVNRSTVITQADQTAGALPDRERQATATLPGTGGHASPQEGIDQDQGEDPPDCDFFTWHVDQAEHTKQVNQREP